MKKSLKRSIALLLCCVLALSLAACGGISETPPGTAETAPGTSGTSENTPNNTAVKDTVVIATTGDCGTLDPRKISGDGFFVVAGCYVETLLAPGYDKETQWLLATGIDTVSPEELTIHLREGVTFSNGNPFNADDVMFTFDLWKNDKARAMYMQNVDMEKTKKVDDYTIDLWFTKSDATNLPQMGYIYIVDAESYNEDTYGKDPVGTGAYVVESYVVNSSVTLTARDDYWGDKPSIRNVEFKVIEEDSQKITAVETGVVDVLKTVPLQDAEYLGSLPGYNTEKINTIFQVLMQFNMTENSVLQNKDARFALCHAVNRQAMADIAFDGYATVAVAPFSKNMTDFEPRFENLTDAYAIGYDVELAKEYAEKGGIQGETLSIITNGESTYVLMAQILMEQLQEIGVNATITNYDQATIRTVMADYASGWDIVLTYSSCPSSLAADILHGYVAKRNIAGWEGPDKESYVALGQQILGNPDMAARSDQLFELLKLHEETMPWYGICDRQLVTCYSKNLSNFRIWGEGGLRVQDWSFAS